MDFLTAVNTATGQVRSEGLGDGASDQACLLLAIHAGRQLAAADPVWSLLVLEASAVIGQLYGQPAPIVLHVEAPDGDTAEVRAAVNGLLLAMADRYDQASATASTSRGLALAAAAIRMRDMAGQLT